MELTSLNALSPLDGRYHDKTAALSPYFSEAALIRYRVRVEIEYFIAIHDAAQPPLAPLPDDQQAALREIYHSFSEEDAARIKDIEKVTNHDVKAVEYYIKEELYKTGDFSHSAEFVHFGLTSQDINNTAIPLSLKEAIRDLYLPRLQELIARLNALADEWKDIPMLARTHGQPASPTVLGKEFRVFATRLEAQRQELATLPYPAKFGGATGNFNAHYVAYPDTDWLAFGKRFVEDTLGLSRSQPTTQIEHYDGLARIFDCLRRINVILLDLCQDVWLYVSLDYFKQRTVAGEIGSSAMPHKVNPIDFENAEGNCGLSSAIYEFMSRKLPVSRLQRDLTDSTILRNAGVGIGYAWLAQSSLLKGLDKLLVNPTAIASDLDGQWAVLAEAIQTILRREGYPKPYEALLDLTRGKDNITQSSIREFIMGLDVSEPVRQELLALRPDTYLGNAQSA